MKTLAAVRRRHTRQNQGFLRRHVVPGDFVIGFGPGDIWQVPHRLAADD
jgi:hypothetical protein